MGDYIEREFALDVVRRTSGDYVAAFAEIAHSPAADVRPVVRGRWLCETEIEGHACGECSACHKIRVIDNFCPNCGADMRRGDDDGRD